ncbi:terminase large subunit domain-containing protein [Belnapia moabensis]|uniref:terminase large subunit domain-containing protein n=1 Tax=Belnapia moabensis TaxID=365533 RepID=UPI001FE0DA6D|nr:terminase family protein [Belnapia moabensis]
MPNAALLPVKPMPQRASMSILAAMDDENLWRRWFRNPATYTAWRAWLAAMFALPMSPEQLEIYRTCTGRAEPPSMPVSEGWLACGRRAGKSFHLAALACYLACFRPWSENLSPGERASILILATDRTQAKTIFRYCEALLFEVKLLAPLIERQTAEEIELSNRVTIEITSASYRSVRGRTIVAALIDEIAFLRSDETAANPDEAILAALRPAMATVPGAMLLCASSPYARRGAMWNAYRRWYGVPNDHVLFWRAPTRTMNPTVPQRIIDEAMERDAQSASAEYLAEFRSDVAEFVSREVIDACTAIGRHEYSREMGKTYQAFLDPAGGSGSDSMTLAIGHSEEVGGKVISVIDAVREWVPSFSPSDVTAEAVALLKHYNVRRIQGDRWGGDWVREPLKKAGIEYELSSKSKSDIYRDVLPLLNSHQVELPDIPKLANQFCNLERKTGRGRDSIDHPPGQHDDLANAVAGCLLMTTRGGSSYDRFIALAS